jgi:hypothetical protein
MSKQQWIAENLKLGEEYAGLILGKDGATDYHLILLVGHSSDITWTDAKVWAETMGGELPTRREQTLLFANLSKQFDPRWYWSSEVLGAPPACAWGHLFSNGFQCFSLHRAKFCARAIRRVPISGE